MKLSFFPLFWSASLTNWPLVINYNGKWSLYPRSLTCSGIPGEISTGLMINRANTHQYNIFHVTFASHRQESLIQKQCCSYMHKYITLHDHFASSVASSTLKRILLAKSHWNIYYAINVVIIVCAHGEIFLLKFYRDRTCFCN